MGVEPPFLGTSTYHGKPLPKFHTDPPIIFIENLLTVGETETQYDNRKESN